MTEKSKEALLTIPEELLLRLITGAEKLVNQDSSSIAFCERKSSLSLGFGLKHSS